ncbi:MAG: metal-dependent transcriptional regulator [Chloroflexi bacterium]|nr:metal-dependent transcriptional regulator [Chloroflexota bacterium]
MVDQPEHSKQVEDFLKAVYSLQGQTGRVSTNALSETLMITAPSVTDMAQRLVTSGLVDYQKYRGVLLTTAGEAIALKIIRRHRLIEAYLVTELGYELHEVHSEADRLEHAVSDRFIEAIAHKLDHPTVDPHGDPIPAADGALPVRDLLPLTDLNERLGARVAQIKTNDPDMIQHILERGFKLGSHVQVIARDPFDGPITALVDDEERVVGHNVAEFIFVETDLVEADTDHHRN